MFGRRARSSSDGDSAAPVNLRAKAIGFLARREHSRAEILTKLKRFSTDKAAIEALLDALTSENLLSERRAAQSIVRARSERQGAMRVAGELRARGIAGELADEVLRGLHETEAVRARALWERKFGVAAVDAQGRARQMRFLQTRGFATDVIRAVVPAVGPPGRNGAAFFDGN